MFAALAARAPLRVSLAGGGTDLPDHAAAYGGRVLALAVDVAVEVEAAPRFGAGIDVIWADAKGQLEPLPAFDVLVAQLLAALTSERQPGWRVSSRCGARAGSGLGSSGAFAVAVAALSAAASGRPVTPRAVAARAYDGEHRLGGRAMVGPQDSFASACGGANLLTIGRDLGVAVQPLSLPSRTERWISENLLLFDTGGLHDASVVAAGHSRGPQGDRTALLHRIGALVEPFTAALRTGATDRFGTLLTRNWQLKRQLGDGVTTAAAERVLAHCLAAGAHGGKLVGAGGGGYVLVSVPTDALGAVRDAMGRDEVEELPFSLSHEGVTVSTRPPGSLTVDRHRN